MNTSPPPDAAPPGRSRWLSLLLATCLVVIVVTLFLPQLWNHPPANPAPPEAKGSGPEPPSPGGGPSRQMRRRAALPSLPAPSAQEIVAARMSRFARGRLQIVEAMARHYNVEVPADVQQFFAAAEANRWEEVDRLFKALAQQKKSADHPESLRQLWPAILETYGVAEQAHQWPAQKLLDYGQSILDSLRPGMVYVGGTDPGRFIPTLLNETADGERHIVVTQNALADNTYLQYLGYLYSDRLKTLTPEDSQRSFQDYLSDAQKRVLHDQQFPEEPRQVRPGEDIKITDNRVQVSGQMAVMAINEKLFQRLMDSNPEVPFAIEQSFPFTSTYADAAPLGPIMELRVQDQQNALTPQRAADSLDYWRATTQQLLADPEAADSANVRLTYSKMASEQAALLLDRHYAAEAEQVYRLATEICPSSPEAVFRYVNLLLNQNRTADAAAVAEQGLKAAPDNEQIRNLVEQINKKKSR